MEKRTLFFDIDTQYDFIMPDGKLYAKGAEQIVPVVSDLRAMALDNGCSIIASMDWHDPENPEISDQPDFEKTFPDHCIAGSPGAQQVRAIRDPAEYAVEFLDFPTLARYSVD